MGPMLGGHVRDIPGEQGVTKGHKSLGQVAAARVSAPLPRWLLSPKGGPGGGAAASALREVFWSVLTRRGSGGGLWPGGIPVSGLRAFLILENRKLRDFSTGFRFLRREAGGQTAPLDHHCGMARGLKKHRKGKIHQCVCCKFWVQKSLYSFFFFFLGGNLKIL